MAACTSDRNTPYREGIELDFPVKGGVRIFAGSMVAVDATGYAVPAGNTAGHRFVGVAMEQVNNATGADGAALVRVRTSGLFEFGAASISQANVGAVMYVVDDQTFDDADPGQGVTCGRLLKFVSATKGWIKI